MNTDQRWYLRDRSHDHPDDALRGSSTSEVSYHGRSHLSIKQVPDADRTSMRVSQESDQHYHEESCVGGQSGGGAEQATMCPQGNARINNRVVRPSDLSSTYVSGYSASETLP